MCSVQILFHSLNVLFSCWSLKHKNTVVFFIYRRLVRLAYSSGCKFTILHFNGRGCEHLLTPLLATPYPLSFSIFFLCCVCTNRPAKGCLDKFPYFAEMETVHLVTTHIAVIFFPECKMSMVPVIIFRSENRQSDWANKMLHCY